MFCSRSEPRNYRFDARFTVFLFAVVFFAGDFLAARRTGFFAAGFREGAFLAGFLLAADFFFAAIVFEYCSLYMFLYTLDLKFVRVVQAYT